MPGGTVLNLAVQVPVATGLYQAIGSAAGRAGRFLWVADLARPDALVAVAARVTPGGGGVTRYLSS